MDIDQTLTAEKPSTSKGDKRFGKRQPWEQPCAECGKTILSASYSRALCPECHERCKKAAAKKYRSSEAGKQVHRATMKRWRLAHPDKEKEKRDKYKATHREELKAKGRARYQANIEIEREKSKLRQRIYKGNVAAKLEYAKLIGKAQTCPRLHLTAIDLPCGQRPECWWGKPCEKCADMKRPIHKGFDDWRYF